MNDVFGRGWGGVRGHLEFALVFYLSFYLRRKIYS
jgi:hypothetical protein